LVLTIFSLADAFVLPYSKTAFFYSVSEIIQRVLRQEVAARQAF